MHKKSKPKKRVKKMTEGPSDISKRNLLRGSLAGAAGVVLSTGNRAGAVPHKCAEVASPQRVFLSARPGKRPWLGPELWANRCQDWQLNNGRIECRRGKKGDEVRSIFLLTREIVAGRSSGRITIKTGLLTKSGQQGFCGFMIGVGAGKLDYRAAALAQRGSGKGGGFLATLDTSGKVVFRDYSDEQNPLGYRPLEVCHEVAGASRVQADQEYTLVLDIEPSTKDFSVTLSAYDQHGQLFARAQRVAVPDSELLGGVALLSSPAPKRAGARWWIRDIATSGSKIAIDPDRALGPVLGTLYSLADNTLKLTAQFMPVGESDPQSVMLDYREADSDKPWQPLQTVKLLPGYTAAFRVSGWDSRRDWDYRVRYRTADGDHFYEGRIRREPEKHEDLVVGLYSCIIPTCRPLEADPGRREMPAANFVGRYTPANFMHPHTALVQHSMAQDPDVVLFVGDQFYEHRPTRAETGENIYLDMLYRWYIWMWGFREVTRNRPALILTDDHDVYHANLWGNNGRAAPGGHYGKGGYTQAPDFVNMVHRTQCAHNPDAFDPAPVEQGINVSYGAHVYGGVSFALIEDRKFKTAPVRGKGSDFHQAELLGRRQEEFLRHWKTMHKRLPKICVSQSVWACVQTDPAGEPLLDYDSNGYPPQARNRAVALVKETGAIMLSGDQHLATLVKHGVEDYDDGPVQFSGPAGAARWQRWFEPAQPNSTPTAQTGNFRDAFGNKMRVLAVANPKLTFKEFRVHVKGVKQGLDDRALKTEGYGICRVDKTNKQFQLECWEWHEDPSLPGARQLPGWPYIVPFG